MTTLENNKIELSEIGDNSDLLEIVIENQFWLKYDDVKKALQCFEDNISALYDIETQEQIQYFIKEIFGDFEK
jgi:hypothetical protein